MTKKDRFVQLVQTGTILTSIELIDTTMNREDALRVLSEAQEMPESQIPDNVLEAANKFLSYRLFSNYPRPAWLPT